MNPARHMQTAPCRISLPRHGRCLSSRCRSPLMKQWRPLTVLLLLSLLTCFTIRNAYRIVLKDNDNPASASPRVESLRLPPNASFGACLMMKEDNDLLYEWIAYHYLMLPLRYLVVGSDEGNTQDPNQVLKRWSNSGLQYWVMNSTEFVGRHGPYGRVKNKKNDTDFHHHQFIYRQRAFITACSEFLKEKGIHWVVYVDSDEFVVINSFNEDDDEDYHATYSNNVTYKMRKLISGDGMQESTVLDVIHKMEREIQPIDPCYVMPRLRFGALERLSCNDSQVTTVNQLAQSDYNYAAMSTLRYVQHAGKVNFPANKYGKVMVDLSQMEDVSRAPPNVHRPFKSQCPYPMVWFRDVLFTINHYTASWERYNRAEDERRSCERWMELAFYDQGNSCSQRLHHWFPRFLNRMGRDHAKYLLGVDGTKQIQPDNNQCPPKDFDYSQLQKNKDKKKS